MAHTYDQHEEFTVPDLEHDAVSAHPQSPQAVEFALEDGAHVWIRRQSIDLFDEQTAGSSVEPRELLGRARLNRKLPLG